jgi:hypothetical protein
MQLTVKKIDEDDIFQDIVRIPRKFRGSIPEGELCRCASSLVGFRPLRLARHERGGSNRSGHLPWLCSMAGHLPQKLIPYRRAAIAVQLLP